MKPSSSLQSFVAGTPLPVDVAEINRQLHQLWKNAAGAESEAGLQPVTRASLFNFLVVCDSLDAPEWVSRLLGKLTATHPARAIVVLADPAAATAEPSATVSAHCHAAGGGRSRVCCEQINLQAAGVGVGRLPSIVLPLLEPDLPVVLWWCGNFLAQPDLFARLVATADRFIFDSAQWTDPWAHLPSLRETLRRHTHCRCADLSWTRLAFWQELIAEFFDEPLAANELQQLNALEIVHDGHRGSAWHSALLGAWLAVRLGWSPHSLTERLRCNVQPSQTPPADAGLLRVNLRSPTAEFTITRDPREQTATAAMSTTTACGLPRRRALWPADAATLLGRELNHPQRQDLYEGALAMLSACAGCCGNKPVLSLRPIPAQHDR